MSLGRVFDHSQEGATGIRGGEKKSEIKARRDRQGKGKRSEEKDGVERERTRRNMNLDWEEQDYTPG